MTSVCLITTSERRIRDLEVKLRFLDLGNGNAELDTQWMAGRLALSAVHTVTDMPKALSYGARKPRC
jgi:hypothetical protein